jgi:hypothetical protein
VRVWVGGWGSRLEDHCPCQRVNHDRAGPKLSHWQRVGGFWVLLVLDKWGLYWRVWIVDLKRGTKRSENSGTLNDVSALFVCASDSTPPVRAFPLWNCPRSSANA